MQVCPNCGYTNDDASFLCQQCNALLRPRAAPAQPPAPASTPPAAPAAPAPQAPLPLPARRMSETWRKTLQFFLGLGVGLLPVLFLFLTIGSANSASNRDVTTVLADSGIVLSIVAFIAMIACLIIPRVRFVGYGLLTIVLLSLIVGCISCVVIINQVQL